MVFMDRRGLVLAHAVKTGQTINAAYYSEIETEHVNDKTNLLM